MRALRAIAWACAAALAPGGARAEAAEPVARWAWSIRWMGVEAGRAEVAIERDGAEFTAVATSRTTGMAHLLYPIRDHLLARWGPSGSIAYDTRFREGRFEQDNRVQFGPGSVAVARRQLVDGAWQDSAFQRDAPVGTSDPLHALWRIREAGGDSQFPLFTGSKVLPLVSRVVGTEAVDGVAARRVEIRVSEPGADLDRLVTAWFSEDERRAPVRVAVSTRAGAVEATWAEP